MTAQNVLPRIPPADDCTKCLAKNTTSSFLKGLYLHGIGPFGKL